MDYQQTVAKLGVLVLRLKIVPQRTPLRLPAWSKGNTLRGAFGMAFRRLVCIPQCPRAAACPLDHRCPYKVIFEPSPPAGSERLSKSQDTSRPFVFRPPIEPRTTYAPGEDFEFGLNLIGRAIDYLPYFVLSFRDVARAGLGIGRAPCELTEVLVPGSARVPPASVYSAQDQLFHTPQTQPLADWVEQRLQALGCRPPAARDGSRTTNHELQTVGNEPRASDRGLRTKDKGLRTITVHFLTPTSLKFEGRAGVQPEFHHLFKRVRDRLNMLCTFYGPGPIDADFKGLGERAEDVRTMASKLDWIERSRVSGKTHRPHELSGFVGSCSYQGWLNEFLPWVAAGELIGAGRHTAWGNGQYSLR
jgi:hypothetical protein